MNEVRNYRHQTISELADDIERHQFDPSMMQRSILDMDADHEVVNPSNPFVFLLECIVSAHSASARDHLKTLRKHYPSMAIDRSDLYLSMSDADYVDRVASPSSASFNVIIEYDSLEFKMLTHVSGRYKSATIARDTEINVDGAIFTMEAAVEIKEYSSGIVTASYVDTYKREGRMEHTGLMVERKKLQNNRDVLSFSIDIRQIQVTSSYFTREIAIPFNKTLPFDDQFYKVSAFHRKRKSGLWEELRVSHTEEVYSADSPTVICKIFDDQVSISIPDVYSASEYIGSEIRIDVSSTKGEVDIGLGDYMYTDFHHTLRGIDKERHWGDLEKAFLDVAVIFVSGETVTGGRDGMTFEELRDRVIFNNISDSKIPITDVDVRYLGSDIGFDIKHSVDDLTNRVFRATRRMPKPVHEKLTTPVSSMVAPWVFSMSKKSNNKGLRSFGKRMTIIAETLFSYENGVIDIASDSIHSLLDKKDPYAISEMYNSSRLMYTPYMYAIDISTKEMVVGVYNTKSPKIRGISHIKKNLSLNVDMNTGSTTVAIGERNIIIGLSILSGSEGRYSHALGDLLVQISFLSPTDGQRYWARAYEDITGSGVFSINLKTDFEINPSKNCIRILNCTSISGESSPAFMSLDGEILICYGSDSVPSYYLDGDMVPINKSIERAGSGGLSSESAFLEIAKETKWLWKNYRSADYTPGLVRYEETVQATYPEDVWVINPGSGSTITIKAEGCEITRCIKHHKGDFVFTPGGDPVYKYIKGDPIPPKDIIKFEDTIHRTCDLLLFDAAYVLATDKIYGLYVKDVATTVASWSNNQIEQANKVKLEQTNIYYHPKNTMGYARSMSGIIDLEVSLYIRIDVGSSVFTNPSLREAIEIAFIEEIYKALSSGEVSIGSVYSNLREVYEDAILSLDIKVKNSRGLESVHLKEGMSHMSIKKVLEVRENGLLYAKEDVDIEFIERRI